MSGHSGRYAKGIVLKHKGIQIPNCIYLKLDPWWLRLWKRICGKRQVRLKFFKKLTGKPSYTVLSVAELIALEQWAREHEIPPCTCPASSEPHFHPQELEECRKHIM